MLHEIKINGKTFGIEPDGYEGVLVLTHADGTYTIPCGYHQIKQDAELALGVYDQVTGSMEVEKWQIESYIEAHIEDFIRSNFQAAEFVEP